MTAESTAPHASTVMLASWFMAHKVGMTVLLTTVCTTHGRRFNSNRWPCYRPCCEHTQHASEFGGSTSRLLPFCQRLAVPPPLVVHQHVPQAHHGLDVLLVKVLVQLLVPASTPASHAQGCVQINSCTSSDSCAGACHHSQSAIGSLAAMPHPYQYAHPSCNGATSPVEFAAGYQSLPAILIIGWVCRAVLPSRHCSC